MNLARQTRIFVPRNDLFNHPNWAEIVFGRVIAPMVQIADEYLEWFWFTRYDCPKNMDSDDCDIDKIPAEFINPENKHYRSVRFRYCLPQERQGVFEDECAQLIAQSGCVISDFRQYDLIGDLGNERHLEGDRTPERIQARASLVLNNYCSISKLILHALSGPDENGRFQLPHHLTPNQRSPFHVFHHIYCNATDVPLYVDYIDNVPGNPPQQIVRSQRVYF